MMVYSLMCMYPKIKNNTDNTTLEKRLQEMTEELQISYNSIYQEQLKDAVIIDSIGEGVIVTDEKGNISIVNQVAEELLAVKDTQLLNKNIFEFLTIEDQKENRLSVAKHPTMQALSGTLKTQQYGFVSNKVNPKKVAVLMKSSPLILSGKIIGTVNVFHDITPEKEMEKAKDEFLSIAAHQLRTPLGTMRWHLERLLDGKLGNVSCTIHEALLTLSKRNMQIIGLVNTLLDVSRIDQGKVQEHPEYIDAVEIIKTIVKQLDLDIKKHALTVKISVDADTITSVYLDHELFAQVIENLLSNAIKYNKPKGTIHITIKIYKPIMEIQIQDSGIGIPPEDLTKIFEKFHRAENATLSHAEGTGLGLFIVKSYIDKWNGKIRFESTLGKGTTCYIQLPIKSKTV